jgi:glucose/arabinose dehydrogenase
VAITAHIHQAGKTEPTAARLSGLKLANGFKIEKFAEGLMSPRMLAVSGAGAGYVTHRSLTDVVMLKDTNSDGKVDEQKIVASRPYGPDGMLYLFVGSTCKACPGPNPENATMLQMVPDVRGTIFRIVHR